MKVRGFILLLGLVLSVQHGAANNASLDSELSGLHYPYYSDCRLRCGYGKEGIKSNVETILGMTKRMFKRRCKWVGWDCDRKHSVVQKDEELKKSLIKIRSIDYLKVEAFIANHKMYFMYAGYCHNCHAMSPNVKRFAERFNFDVTAVSFDGEALSEFPDFILNDTHMVDFNIEGFPTLVIVNKSTGVITDKIPGYLSEGVLINKFADVVNHWGFDGNSEISQSVYTKDGALAFNEFNNKEVRDDG